MASTNIKKEILLESLSTHRYLSWDQVISGADQILRLNLNLKPYLRLIIHSYLNGWVGRNSEYFNLELDQIIQKSKYDRIGSLLSDIETCWPEYNNIKPEQKPIVEHYYGFMQNFIYTMLETNLTKNKMDGVRYERPILKFDPMYHVKYEFDDEKVNRSYYELLLKNFKKERGKVPDFKL